MKKEIHPEFKKAHVVCISCGNEFDTYSTLKEIKIDVCSNCHPFYTGKMIGNSRAGRVERFNKKYSKK